MILKPVNAHKCRNIQYIHCIPPTCFSHSGDHPQLGALQTIDTLKYYRSFQTHAEI